MAPQLRSQLLPIGAPASACPRRHLLTGRPWRLVEASCTLGPALCTSPVPSLPRPARRRVDLVDSAGGIRTHGLELMRLARTARLLYRAIWPAGVEPAVSGSRNRRGGRAPLRPVVHRVDDRGIEPRTTAVSERRLTTRPVVGSPSLAHRCCSAVATATAGAFRDLPRPHGGDPSGRNPLGGFLLANRRRASPGNRTLLHGVTARGLATSLATQSRREESNPRGPR